MIIKIKDETATGKITGEFDILSESLQLTLKEIIRMRIYVEVDKFNKQRKQQYYGLVQPTESEKILNGFKLNKFREIDPEKHYYVALDMFQKNGFFVLVDDLQETDLDQVLTLKENSVVSFVKLTALVGG